jgi:hypothetical protein
MIDFVALSTLPDLTFTSAAEAGFSGCLPQA